MDPKNRTRIFMAGERIMSRWFDVDALDVSGKRGKWTDGPTPHLEVQSGLRHGGDVRARGRSSTPGGGGNTDLDPVARRQGAVPTATAEKIDLNAASPAWTSAGSMAFPRRHLNSTVLPDGTVLITGGTSGGGFVDINPARRRAGGGALGPEDQSVDHARLQQRDAGVPLGLAAPARRHRAPRRQRQRAGRAAPSVPDETNHEIFSPPYLFKGARPTITSAPATRELRTDVRGRHARTRRRSPTCAGSGSAPSPTRSTWAQRANTLSFTRTATGVDVTAPASARAGAAGALPALHPQPERRAVSGEDRSGRLGRP